MVDLVSQLREGVEKKYSRESLETMLLWGADEIERLRRELAETQAHLGMCNSDLDETNRAISELQRRPRP